MRHLYLELLLSDHNSFCTPPCRDACPTHIKIPQFLDAVAHGDYRAGVRKLREDLPFPAILGRVCPRPCEEPCRRQLVDDSITICWLHRFMADQCLDDEQTGELLLPVEPEARQRQDDRRRRRRSGRPGVRLLRPARGSRRQDLRGAAAAGRHAALRHPELPPAARRDRQGAERPVAHGRRDRVRHASRRRLSSSTISRPATTRSSWAWAPSPPRRSGSSTTTPTASSPRSSCSARSSSPARCRSATRWPSSATASPPSRPAAWRCARAPRGHLLCGRSPDEMSAPADEVDGHRRRGRAARDARRACARRRQTPRAR